ncbi:helix-turn-helix domain-containing protein [Streptomyces sp. R1]|uniref:helix-turn-helix domain-containing protein n=1 Tax=Streptomyces sp. R1 TaxID=1509279 RepID=UPI001E358008|nr:helix-turn-helix domain-containing protein [Streptomyces sp. R1]MCC8341140.1 helix-turn-helix domain-containing protein [Streptomyces sp. R1]
MLRELRQHRGLTLEELAESSGVSARAIGDMERGRSLRPRRGTVAALSQGLELDSRIQSELLAAARVSDGRAARSVGAQEAPFAVPRGVPDFVGRHPELDALRTLAHRPFNTSVTPEQQGSVVPPPVAVVSGTPGSGKTTLALRIAQECRDTFEDGAFLLDMRGLEAQPLSADEAVVRLLGAWGVGESDSVAMTREDRLAQFQERAAELHALVILDNAADEAQVRPLLPRAGRVLTVVTGRGALAGLEDVHRVELGALDLPESAALLRAVIGDSRVEAEPEAVEAVARLCGHLPLALRLAANWAATRTNWNLGRLVTRLEDEDRRLDLLSAGDRQVTSVFSLSYSRLTTDAARMFRRLSLVPGADFGAPLAAVLSGFPVPVTEELLEELLDVGLLSTFGKDRYRFHDLVRLYARSRQLAEEGAEGTDAHAQRARTWLLDTAALAGRWYEPGYGAPEPDPARLVSFEDTGQAMRWIKTESANWAGAFRTAAELGEHLKVVEVAEAMHWFSDNWLLSGLWVEVYERSSAAAAALGDAVLEAAHLNYLTWSYEACERRHDDAFAAAERALTAARAGGSVLQEAWARQYTAWLQTTLGDHAAVDSSRVAMELFEEADEINGYLQSCSTAIYSLSMTERSAEAVAVFKKIEAALDDPRHAELIPIDVRRSTALAAAFHVSYAFVRQERWDETVQVLRPIRGDFAERGYYDQEAKTRLHLAHALARLGRQPDAAEEYRSVGELEGRVSQSLTEAATVRLAALADGRIDPPTPF